MLAMPSEPVVDAAPGLPRRVGVALGSGSARGLAHIGVLHAIEEAGLEVAAIAGASMGAFIGGVYAAGRLERLAAEFRAMDWKGITALLDPVFARSGLIGGQKVADWVRAQVGAVTIESLPIAFRAIATDLASGEAVAIGAGDLIEAVRTSIAVPGIFTPARVNGRVLVDGGRVDPVPVGAVRALGADFVIAVDLNRDIVQHRLGRTTAASGNDRPYAQALARLLGNGTADSPVRAQLRRWLAREKAAAARHLRRSAGVDLHHAGAHHARHAAPRSAAGPGPAAAGRGAVHGVRPCARDHRHRLPRRQGVPGRVAAVAPPVPGTHARGRHTWH